MSISNATDSTKIYQKDPVARLLIDRVGLTPLRFAFVVLVWEILSNVIPSIKFGVLTEGKDGVQPFLSLINILFAFVVTPIACAFYLWISKAPSELFRRLRSSQVFEAKHDELSAWIENQIREIYHHWIWMVATLYVLACAVYIAWNGQMYRQMWIYVNPVYFVFKASEMVLGWYTVCMVVAHELATIQILRNLFKRYSVKLYPLHPDRCGGLLPINEYAMNFTYFIAVAGIGLSLIAFAGVQDHHFWQDSLLQFAIGAYVFLGVFCFFAPLDAAHDAMKETKGRWLMEISNQFQRAYESTQKILRVSSNRLRGQIDRINQLQQIYELTDEFPVWPFDIKTLRRFGATIVASLSPLLASLLGELVKLVLKINF